MPKISHTSNWVKEYRDLLKETFANNPESSWFIGEHNGQIRLQVKYAGKKQTRVIPFEWSKKGFSSAIPEIQQIYKNFWESNDRTLSSACERVAVSNSNAKTDYSALIEEFRLFVPNASEETWNKSYVPVLYKAKELLERSKGKPQNGEQLLLLSLKKWEQGSRSRQIARRSLTKFLNWATQRVKLPSAYSPPPTVPEIRKPKRIGYAFSDQEILALIDSEQNENWKFAFQLLAVYGLRPEELRFLRIMDGSTGKELWSTYRKSKGGNKGEKTEPRRLNPLFVKDIDNKPIDWKLQQRLEIGEQLPPLGSEGQGGLALLTHLKRMPIYKKIKQKALSRDQYAVPYSFRHRYSKASHANGIPIANIAEAMGHTVEVHMDNYSRFAPDSTGEIYSKANQLVNQ